MANCTQMNISSNLDQEDLLIKNKQTKNLAGLLKAPGNTLSWKKILPVKDGNP